MKKLLLAGVLLLPFVASATQLCSSQADWSYTTWSGSGFSCEADDLIFSNFSVSNVPSSMYLNFMADAAGNTIVLNLVNTTFAQSFSFSYEVTFDDTAFPANNGTEWVIATASAGVQAETGAYGTLTKRVYQSDGVTFIGADTYSQSGTTGGDIGPVSVNQTQIHVADSFDYTSGTFYDASNTFTNIQLPEPSAMAVVGGALIGLGVMVRGRRRRR